MSLLKSDFFYLGGLGRESDRFNPQAVELSIGGLVGKGMRTSLFWTRVAQPSVCLATS